MKSKEQIELEELELKIHELKLLKTKEQWTKFVRNFYADLNDIMKRQKNINNILRKKSIS